MYPSNQGVYRGGFRGGRRGSGLPTRGSPYNRGGFAVRGRGGGGETHVENEGASNGTDHGLADFSGPHPQRIFHMGAIYEAEGVSQAARHQFAAPPSRDTPLPTTGPCRTCGDPRHSWRECVGRCMHCGLDHTGCKCRFAQEAGVYSDEELADRQGAGVAAPASTAPLTPDEEQAQIAFVEKTLNDLKARVMRREIQKEVRRKLQRLLGSVQEDLTEAGEVAAAPVAQRVPGVAAVVTPVIKPEPTQDDTAAANAATTAVPLHQIPLAPEQPEVPAFQPQTPTSQPEPSAFQPQTPAQQLPPQPPQPPPPNGQLRPHVLPVTFGQPSTPATRMTTPSVFQRIFGGH